MRSPRSKGVRPDRVRGAWVWVVTVVALLVGVPGAAGIAGATGAAGAAAQSVLERPPNFQGSWVGESGTIYFNTLHRFTATGPPARKVVNYPTLLFGVGLPLDVLVGANYSTNSALVPQVPNEWEFFARYSPLAESDGAPLGIGVQAGFNEAARSWDGQLSVGKELGPAELMAAGRVFSNAFDAGSTRYAWAGGMTLRLAEFAAVAADYGDLVDRAATEGEPVWGVGLQLAIPYTPHTLSFQVSNARATTLEGASVGSDETRYGFEFTVPFTLSRYLGSGGGGNSARTAGPTAEMADGVRTGDVAAEVGMTNRLTFTPETVRVRVGETVRWRNSSDLLHTVTADPEKVSDPANVSLPEGAAPFDSGNLEPGATFDHTFTQPGRYKYVCIPHEAAAMIGWVIVSEPEPGGANGPDA